MIRNFKPLTLLDVAVKVCSLLTIECAISKGDHRKECFSKAQLLIGLRLIDRKKTFEIHFLLFEYEFRTHGHSIIATIKQ